MARILITDAKHPLAEELTGLLRAAGHEVYLNREEISTREQMKKLVKEFGTPDLVILTEYTPLRETLTDGNADVIASEVEKKLVSAFLFAKHFGAKMAETGNGGILILGSIAADKPTASVPAYAMTQGAFEMMTRELALFYGNYGVRVNMVKLGPTKEEDPVFESDLVRAYYDADNKTPLKARVTAEDACGAVEYFLSPAARLVNGAELKIDGGLVQYYFGRGYVPFREEDL